MRNVLAREHDASRIGPHRAGHDAEEGLARDDQVLRPVAQLERCRVRSPRRVGVQPGDVGHPGQGVDGLQVDGDLHLSAVANGRLGDEPGDLRVQVDAILAQVLGGLARVIDQHEAVGVGAGRAGVEDGVARADLVGDRRVEHHGRPLLAQESGNRQGGGGSFFQGSSASSPGSC